MTAIFSNQSGRGALLLAFGLAGGLPACGSTSADGGGGSGGAPMGSGAASAAAGGAASGGSDAAALETTYLKASNAGASDLFGAAVALSADGNTLVVGAAAESSGATGVSGDQADDSAPGAGAAYVYVRSGTTWVQEAYLKASNTGAGDGFGSALALSADGSTLAVGAPYEAGAAGSDPSDDTAPAAGAVYLFVRGDTAWEQQAYLKASGGDADDFFGLALALSADGALLAVGAEGEDGAATGIGGDEGEKTEPESGAVYLFRESAGVWQPSDYLKASNTGAFDHFGGAVALSADGATLAVGGYWEDSNATGIGGDETNESATSAGAVYVFGHDGAAWTQAAYVKGAANDGNASDTFGCAVSLSADGSTLAVGAVGDPSALVGVGDNEGGGTMPYAGAAYVFGRSGAAWEQAAFLKASNPGAGDEFGYHLQLSADGTTLVVGAALEASLAGEADDSGPGAGAAYVFARDGAAWAQTDFLKAPNVDAGDRFGWAVASSADGGVLAVGATRESSGATGVDGDATDNGASRAGAAYVGELR